MQLLFLILFGGIVSFILYLSHQSYVSEKKLKEETKETSNTVNEMSELIETNSFENEELLEKVKEDVEGDSDTHVTKFRARRTSGKERDKDEEII